MQPDRAAPFLMTVIRALSEAQSNGPIEWEFTETWDDGYGMGRVIVEPGGEVWSPARQSWVTLSFFVGVAFDGVPLNTDGRRPSVPRFRDQPGGSEPIPLDDPRLTSTTSWLSVVMNHLGGSEPRQFDNGWVGFQVTLPDEAPEGIAR